MSVILCTAGYDHTIRFWEALSGICSRTIPHPDSQVNRLCISPDKRYLAAAGHHTVKLYDIKSTNPAAVLTFEGHTNNITGVQFHCEGKWMVTSSEDGTVKVWDTRTGTVQRNYSHGAPVNDVVIHPNQGELISCDRAGNVRVWDLGENKCSHQLVPEDDQSISSVSVASDGSMLVAGNNAGNIYVWRMIQAKDLTSLVPVTKFTAHNTYITRVLLSPDVRQLATCSADHTARIWQVDPGASQPLAQMMGTVSLDGSPSDSALSGQTQGADPFPLMMTLQGHQRWVWDCAFSADSAYLVTACSDHYARLWDLSTQGIIRQYNGHHRGAVCVALNDTAVGQRLAFFSPPIPTTDSTSDYATSQTNTANITEDSFELGEMRGEQDASTSVAQEAERLLSDEPRYDVSSSHARPDIVDESILGSPGWFIWALTFSAGVSGLLFGYDTGVISSTLVSIGTDLSNRPLTTLDKSLITSATSLFALIASPVAGILADWLGRKKVILLADILFILGALWQAFSKDVVNMIIGRAVVGAAVGIASFVTPMYISELAPSPFRGRLVTIQALLVTGGQVVAYIVGWVFSTTSHGWKDMVGIGAVPALFQLVSVIFMPETPRWLVRSGRGETALAVLVRTYRSSTAQGPSQRQQELLAEQILSKIEREVRLEDDIRNARATPDTQKTGLSASVDHVSHVFSELLTVGSNLRALKIACMLQGCQQLCGFNSLMYFSATIFALVGFKSPTLTALSIASTNFLFTLVAFYSIDRVGRRRILLYSVPFMVVGLALCAFAFLFVDLPVGDGPSNVDRPIASGAWPTILLVSMILYVASYATGLGNVPWQQSELFPLSVRSLGSSVATGTNWFSNTLVGLTFLPMMELLTPTGTFVLYAAVCVLTWVTIWHCYPETAGLELEDVSELLKDDWGVDRSIKLFTARHKNGALQQPSRQD